MWLSEVDATSYVLLISVLIILGIFVLLVFGSLPCSCRYICLLNHCLWRRKNHRTRVADSEDPNYNNGMHVISAGIIPDPASLIQFPIYPFATEPHPQVHGSRPLRLVHVHEGTGGLSSLPCYYEYFQNQLKFPPAKRSSWDEPPPSYETIFPTTLPGPSNSEMDNSNNKSLGSIEKSQLPPV